ncbi:MAG: ABC transporter permease [Prevotellaceae bacterium]|jgi:uncharacterized membrane protein YraQ (UPF0718 family)|nr:ABC transporter permease [Prevotellaceae bacterium]
MKTEVAKFLLDVAKLLIGGILLAGVMRQDISPVVLFSIGGGITVLFIAVAFAIIWWDNKNK